MFANIHREIWNIEFVPCFDSLVVTRSAVYIFQISVSHECAVDTPTRFVKADSAGGPCLALHHGYVGDRLSLADLDVGGCRVGSRCHFIPVNGSGYAA
jgi:hypothetical protein